MLFFSPLEQFEIRILYPIFENGLDTSITQSTIFIWLVFLHFSLFFSLGFVRARLIPSPLQSLCEQSYLFIISIIKQQIGSRGLKFFPIIFVTFFIILFSNLIGLVPFAFTPTSHIILTFSLAFACNLAFIIIGFYENGFAFLKLFAPKGGPKWLFPIIVLIELVSYLLRTFSLSIRLFANIMAGHTLLHILSSFVSAFILVYPSLALFPFLLVLAVVGLEIGVAILQAYVFTILLCIYLNDSLHPSH